MLASERRDLLSDVHDRLSDLYVRRNEAGRTGDWELADSIDAEIVKARVQRAKIRGRDMGENPWGSDEKRL